MRAHGGGGGRVRVRVLCELIRASLAKRRRREALRPLAMTRLWLPLYAATTPGRGADDRPGTPPPSECLSGPRKRSSPPSRPSTCAPPPSRTAVAAPRRMRRGVAGVLALATTRTCPEGLSPQQGVSDGTPTPTVHIRSTSATALEPGAEPDRCVHHNPKTLSSCRRAPGRALGFLANRWLTLGSLLVASSIKRIFWGVRAARAAPPASRPRPSAGQRTLTTHRRPCTGSKPRARTKERA